MAAVARSGQRGGKAPDRNFVILEYLRSLPAVLGGVAAVLVALTGLLALLVE